MALQDNKAINVGLNQSERTGNARKKYHAAKFETFFLGQDVITASDGGENGWGIQWDWKIDDIWGE